MAEVSDEELQKVIGDFPDMGHVDNIAAMAAVRAAVTDPDPLVLEVARDIPGEGA